MPILCEADGRGPSATTLLLHGVGALMVVALLITGLIAKMNGVFDKAFEVTAVLADVGDGLPARSDVKFRGVLVGVVNSVDTSSGGESKYVDIALKPEYAAGIPATVTARVVPSNVFAVSSVQLVDNGSGPPLSPGAEIPQDESLSTVQLQTALTKLREIVSATARIGTDRTLGMLAAVAAATDRRGADIVTAGEQLRRIAAELGELTTPNGEPSSLGALSSAIRGLQEAAPDLLDAVHHSVVPMRTLAQKDAALTALLTAGSTTLSEVGSVLDNNTDKIVAITTQLSPVLSVVADGSTEFAPIVTRMKVISDKWFSEFWPVGQQNATGKFLFQFTPHKMYTRADCPRYGELAGPSCATAPETAAPPVVADGVARQFDFAPTSGGNVGPVGSAQEKELLGDLLGGESTPADEFILGPLARGNTVQVTPEPDVPLELEQGIR